MSSRQLDQFGEGTCSVPMWMNGLPAGLCGERAFGERPQCREWRDAYTGEMMREDGRYNGYAPGLACPRHGGPSIRTFKDGGAWCAVHPNFVDLQESPAGFGATPEEAQVALMAATADDTRKEENP